MTRFVTISAVVAASLAVAACSTVNRLNPFAKD